MNYKSRINNINTITITNYTKNNVIIINNNTNTTYYNNNNN